MYYLEHRKEPGLHSYLVNLLYRRSDDVINFYLPQLCQLALRDLVRLPSQGPSTQRADVSKFILDKGAKSMHLALKANWLFQAVPDDNVHSEIARDLSEGLEMAVVNSGRRRGSGSAEMPDACLPDVFLRRKLVKRLTVGEEVSLEPEMHTAASSPDFRAYDKIVDELPHSPSCDDVRTREPPGVCKSEWPSAPGFRFDERPVQVASDFINVSHLGNPFKHESLDREASVVDEDLHKFFIKSRRCEYFNAVNCFVELSIKLSNSLVLELDKDQRLDLAKGFFERMNSWMFFRRCVVAATEGCFIMSGLSIPMHKIGPDPEQFASSLDGQHATQILSIVSEECRVLSSRKRAPYLCVMEVADLDEDVRRIAAELQSDSNFKFEWDDMYVLDSVLSDIRIKSFYVPKGSTSAVNYYEILEATKLNMSSDTRGSTVMAEDLLAPETPLSAIRRSMAAHGPTTTVTTPPSCVSESKATSAKESVLQSPEVSSDEASIKDPSAWSVFGRSKKTDKVEKRQIEKMGERSLEELADRAPEVRRSLWGELWEDKKCRLKERSPYGQLKSWNLVAVMIKGGDDVRQELLASQLIHQFKDVFEDAGLPLWIFPYDILVAGSGCGIIEYVPNTASVDAMKRTMKEENLARVFEAAFADCIDEARKNFIESHAAYSLISHILQVKDRHNGNLLLTAEGHLVHIDYGFVLSNSPGSVGFETSPFKLTGEILDIMQGPDSDNFEYFRRLVISGFLEARKSAEKIILLVEMMMTATTMPCFSGNAEFALQQLKERFMLKLPERQCINHILSLIDQSVNNWRTVQYDTFQRITNGIW
ncbi:MAG: uncharacterized protein KVP18_004767 [Porospora cf. gigantea A]|uniref:uncharacterized protein n=2 Tax=Porospora cf. gigantea A TaxID=2853593 RepID=UPI00355A8698|nr:MAG: hypothetical protein KVP18_004767 [Porospora cf. gigantea A]